MPLPLLQNEMRAAMVEVARMEVAIVDDAKVEVVMVDDVREAVVVDVDSSTAAEEEMEETERDGSERMTKMSAQPRDEIDTRSQLPHV